MIMSPDNVVYVHFFADTNVNGRGFNITYTAIDDGRSIYSVTFAILWDDLPYFTYTENMLLLT